MAEESRKRGQKAEEERREREYLRLDQELHDKLLREDYARQRHAVAKCVRELRSEASVTRQRVKDRVRKFDEQAVNSDNGSSNLANDLVGIWEDYYTGCFLSVRELELEVTHPALGKCINELTSAYAATIRYHNEMSVLGTQEYGKTISSHSPLTGPLQKALNKLGDEAIANLHVPIEILDPQKSTSLEKVRVR